MMPDVEIFLRRLHHAGGHVTWTSADIIPYRELNEAVELGYANWIGGPRGYSSGCRITKKGRAAIGVTILDRIRRLIGQPARQL